MKQDIAVGRNDFKCDYPRVHPYPPPVSEGVKVGAAPGVA